MCKVKVRKKDLPISYKTLIEKDIFSNLQWEYISSCAVRLFNYAYEIYYNCGFILADTKMEFGYQSKNNHNNKDLNSSLTDITVIDELFTPDSSRIWLLKEHQPKLDSKGLPISYDKDLLRKVIDNYKTVNSNYNQDLSFKLQYKIIDSYLNVLSKLIIYAPVEFANIKTDQDLDQPISFDHINSTVKTFF